MTRLLYIAAIAAIIIYLIWPFGSLLRFYVALKSSDEPAVESMVEWPLVRKNIAQDLNRSAGRLLNEKFGNTAGKAGIKFKLDFTSISVADRLAGIIATPEAFIFLFNEPSKLHCFKGLRKLPEASAPDDCEKVESESRSEKDTKISIRGPNFGRIYEKTNYLFFTDPLTFKFDVLHDDVPVVLLFERRTFSWVLTGLNVDWEKVIKTFSDKS